MKYRTGDTISVRGWSGIAFYINDIQGDNITAIMVGDDRKHYIKDYECEPLKSSEYCVECGQIGCSHNVVV